MTEEPTSSAPSGAPEMLPSEIIKARAAKITIVTDKLGRKIGIRRLGGLQRINVNRIISVDDANKPAISGLYALAYSCASIDGNDYPVPSTLGELDMTLQRLDDEGIDAIANHIGQQLGIGDKSPIVEQAKNS